MFPVVGVHLGQDDLPPSAARTILGGDKRVGFSTHSEGQIGVANEDDNVDVVALGPIFQTASKERPDPVVGIDGLMRARRLCSKPLVAIGGIGTQNAGSVLSAGADAVAVIGALMTSPESVSMAPSLARLRENGERLIEATLPLSGRRR
jgi:thiamine-phosphate pyrophosphorylase